MDNIIKKFEKELLIIHESIVEYQKIVEDQKSSICQKATAKDNIQEQEKRIYFYCECLRDLKLITETQCKEYKLKYLHRWLSVN